MPQLRRAPSLIDLALIAAAAGAFAFAVTMARAEEKKPAPAAAPPAAAQPATPPPVRFTREEGQAAIAKARAGDRADLTRMAQAGDPNAQAALGDILFRNEGRKPDYKGARTWYEKAAMQGHPQANRTLGEMYAKGQGGKKDPKKAMQYWVAAEKAGDPLAPILVADELFSKITGGKQPKPGTYAFRGGIPAADVEVAIDWYETALKRDPRPEVKTRAEAALHALKTFQQAANVKVDKK